MLEDTDQLCIRPCLNPIDVCIIVSLRGFTREMLEYNNAPPYLFRDIVH